LPIFFHPFMCLNNIPLYAFATFYLPIYQLVDTWIVLAIMNSVAMNIYLQVFR
jgi:hypothetical protein